MFKEKSVLTLMDSVDIEHKYSDPQLPNITTTGYHFWTNKISSLSRGTYL